MMKTGYAVADVMTTKPITCTKETTIKACAALMKQHEVGSVLIVEGEQLIGIATDKDFIYKAMALDLPTSAPVEKIMSSLMIWTKPGEDLFDAVMLMNKKGIRHLPVMEDGKLVGYLTMATVLKIEPQLFELLAEKVELRGISPGSSLLDSFDDELSGQCESCGNYSSRLFDEDGQKLCPNCLSR